MGYCFDTCSGGCSNACSRACKTACNTNCTGGCNSTCREGSAGTGYCGQSCGSGCGNNCAHLCQDTCDTKCTTSCGTSCEQNCATGCTSGCQYTCSSNCGKQCGGCGQNCTVICANACKNGCSTSCENACGSCSHGCAVVANQSAYEYIKLGIQKMLKGKDARMLRDLFMEEIYRRLQNPFHKYSEVATSTTIIIKSEENETYANNFVKEIIYVVVNGIQLNDTQYSFNSQNNSINIPNLSTGSSVIISYVTTAENDSMLILYETGKMLVDNNLLSSIKVSDSINETVDYKHLAKQVVPEEYRKVAVALYDQMIANDPNENGSSWADE